MKRRYEGDQVRARLISDGEVEEFVSYRHVAEAVDVYTRPCRRAGVWFETHDRSSGPSEPPQQAAGPTTDVEHRGPSAHRRACQSTNGAYASLCDRGCSSLNRPNSESNRIPVLLMVRSVFATKSTEAEAAELVAPNRPVADRLSTLVLPPCHDRAVEETIVLPAQSPRRPALEADGWVVLARSFGAQLDSDIIDHQRLLMLVAEASGSVRELGDTDVDAVLRLDTTTIADYPGSMTTQHTPLDRGAATPSLSRRAFGAFTPDGDLVAMTFVDVDGTEAETHFTVVHRAWRGRGLSIAVKAASVLVLTAGGVTRFRTGGSAENTAILRANDAVGYVRDEEWLTLAQNVR